MSAAGAILAIERLTIALPADGERKFALEEVSFELGAGEIVCVVGESGSGKTVLTRAVLGGLPPGLRRTQGTIQLRGSDLASLTPQGWRGVRGARVALIPQDPMAALNPSAHVGAQIEEVFAIHTKMKPSDRRAAALDLLRRMALGDPERIARAWPHQLSGGQCQRVCIAMALALNPEVLIADEPTTALDVTTQAQVLELIRALRDRHGQSVLFITHDLAVVAEIADRVAVLEKGRLVEIGSAKTILSNPTKDYTKRLIAAAPSLTPPAAAPAARRGEASVAALSCEGISKYYGAVAAVDRIDLIVRRGETLAVVGESGSGKTTLARLLVGLIEPSAGSARVREINLASFAGSRLRRARRVVQMVFQDPFSALNPRRAVGEAIARAAFLAGLDSNAARARALALLGLVGLESNAFERLPEAFSGGQRQRISIARALAMSPDVLIADECVSALDVSVQAQVLALLGELKRTMDLTIVFITHDLRVAAQISDRIAVMHAGKIIEIGDARDVLGAPRAPYTQALIAAAPGRGRI